MTGSTTYSTPRRLALIARGLPLATEAVSEELKGPRTSAPPQALEGFLRKTGLTQDQLEDRDGTWFARIDKPGRATGEVLAEAVARDRPRLSLAQVDALGRGIEHRPHRCAGCGRCTRSSRCSARRSCRSRSTASTCGATTLGHRFHHPGPITIGGAHDYVEKLRACHVIVDQEEREAIIREGAVEAAAEAGFTLVEDEGLVVENAGLTEWPVPLLGSFDPAFLDVPEEVIQLTTRTNQKYFVMRGRGRGARAAFRLRRQHQRQRRRRGDRRRQRAGARRAAGRRALLLGAGPQGSARGAGEEARPASSSTRSSAPSPTRSSGSPSWPRWLVEEGIVKGADPDQAERAARLAKADLVTGMVGEFPELQGVIGGYLARAQGEPDAIADAIRDHYKPVGQGDEVPTAPVTRGGEPGGQAGQPDLLLCH